MEFINCIVLQLKIVGNVIKKYDVREFENDLSASDGKDDWKEKSVLPLRSERHVKSTTER